MTRQGKILFYAFAFLLCSSALAENSARWRGVFYGRATDDTLSASRVAGANGIVDVHRDFGESLHAHFQGGVKLEAGSSSSLFTDEFQPSSSIFLIDARLDWTVWGPLYVSAGALRQTHINSPLLIPDATFPATIVGLQHKEGFWRASLIGEAAIPTGQRLATKSTGKENLPLLLTQTGVVAYEDGNNFSVLHLTHFDFRDLTRGMAQDSRFYGNTVNGIAASSTFAYRFEGYELGGDFSLGLGGQWSLLTGVSYLQNRTAPTTRNEGRYGYAGVLFKGEKFSLRPVAEYYENESDASPAFYSSRAFGHNNRRGYGGSIKAELQDPGLELEFRARSSKLIEAQPFQKDKFQYFEILVGIPYANF